MEILKYKQGVKTFNKNDLLKEIVVQRGFLSNVEGTFKLAKANDLDLDQYVDRWVITKSLKEKALSQYGLRAPLLSAIEADIKVWNRILDTVEKTLRHESDNIIDGATLTIRQANCLMMIDQCNFFCNFTLNLVEVLLSMGLKGKDPEQSGVPKADLAFLNKTYTYYLEIFMQIYKDHGDIVKRIENAPDVELDETSLEIVTKGEGENKIRPLTTKNLGAHYFTPIYWIKSLKADYDIGRIRDLRESNELHAMKIEQLANRRNGQNDPKLDRQIEIYQERIIKNRAKIEEIEANYE